MTMMLLSRSTSSILVVLSGVALGLNLWLLFRSRRGPALPGCGAASGCGEVLASRWSKWLGVPVTLPGAAVYLLLLAATLAWRYSGSTGARTFGARAAVAAALVAVTAGVWFVALQVMVVRRLCTYCTAAHAIGFCACVVLATQAALGGPASAPLRGALADPTVLAVAASALAGLVAGQLLVRPQLYAVSSTAPSPVSSPPGLPQSGGSQTAPLSAPVVPPTTRADGRTVSFMTGRVTLSVSDWPALGPPDAPLVVAYLFDYTCPTCRKVHRLLLESLTLCGPRVAVLLVPAPVDPTCNPHVRRRTATHAHACRYARLGLDVWRHAPGAFAEYDRWVFEPANPPPIGVARNFAERLVGSSDLDPSVPDGELDGLIAKGVEAYRASGAEAMPTLLFPHAVLRGEVPSAARLAEILREQEWTQRQCH